jgi:hypothetical protein
MPLGHRVDLEGDVVAFLEIGKGGSEQSPGCFHERHVPLPGKVDGDTGPGRPRRADTFGESRGQEGRREKLVPPRGRRRTVVSDMTGFNT